MGQTIPQDTTKIAEAINFEKILLGSIMYAEEVLPKAISKLEPDDFYLATHRKIFCGIIEQANSGDLVDFISVFDRVTGMEFSYFTDLNECRLPSHVDYLVNKIIAASRRRKAQQILQAAMDALGSYDTDIVAEFQNMSDEVVAMVANDGRIESIAEGMIETLKEIENRAERKIVRTGFSALDMVVGGFFPGAYWVVAGRTSMGKSSFCQNLMLNCVKKGNSAAYVSVEGDNMELRRRLLAIESRVPISRIDSGNIDGTQPIEISSASGRISDLPIYYIDKETLWPRIKARIELLKFRCPQLAVVFVDYLGDVHLQGYKNRWDEIGEISRQFKHLCTTLKIAGVMACQINRATEGRKKHEPTMADLRDSGSVEQNADVVLLMYRPGYYDKKADQTEVKIGVAKQRNGPTGVLELKFDGPCLRFYDED